MYDYSDRRKNIFIVYSVVRVWISPIGTFLVAWWLEITLYSYFAPFVLTSAIGTTFVAIRFTLATDCVRYGKKLYLLHLVGFVVVTVPLGFATIFEVFDHSQACLIGEKTEFSSVYFSYVTLTTLGYGDYHPVGGCRLFSSTEAITGYLSLGLLTATFYWLLSASSHPTENLNLEDDVHVHSEASTAHSTSSSVDNAGLTDTFKMTFPRLFHWIEDANDDV